MSLRRVRYLLGCLLIGLSITPAAHAQWAVVDVGAIAQLVEQLNTMRQQLETTRDQLQQTRETLDSMRGGRGMERLLEGTTRNYLPADWAQMAAVLGQASTGYGALAAELQRLIDVNAVLRPDQIASLSPAERSQLEAARRSAALLQALTREALSTTSRRFQSIQQLINAISQANDQKSILDLQARIQAEQSMLQNESTSPRVVTEIRRLICSRAASLDGRSATEPSVNTSLVVIGGESIQLATEVEAVPEEGLIEILAPKGSDKALYKRACCSR